MSMVDRSSSEMNNAIPEESEWSGKGLRDGVSLIGLKDSEFLIFLLSRFLALHEVFDVDLISSVEC